MTLEATTTHVITPEWETLGDSPLVILVDVGNDGTVDETLRLKNETTEIKQHSSLSPTKCRLEQNYPKPFNPAPTIRYGLPQRSVVKLSVFKLLGQAVATLAHTEQEAGYHEVTFYAYSLASGVYVYRLQAGDFIQSRKPVLLR